MMKKACFFILAVLVIGTFASEPVNRERRQAVEAISKAIASTEAAIQAMEAARARAARANKDNVPVIRVADIINPKVQHSLRKRQAEREGLIDSSADLFGALEGVLKSISSFMKPLLELFNSSAGNGEE